MTTRPGVRNPSGGGAGGDGGPEAASDSSETARAPAVTEAEDWAQLREHVLGLMSESWQLRQARIAAAHNQNVARLETRQILLDIAEFRDGYRELHEKAKLERDPLPAAWLARIARMEGKLDEILQKYEVTERIPAGVPEPGLDEVLEEVQSDGAVPGEIVGVVRRGLLWQGQMLRLAQVIVAA